MVLRRDSCSSTCAWSAGSGFGVVICGGGGAPPSWGWRGEPGGEGKSDVGGGLRGEGGGASMLPGKGGRGMAGGGEGRVC